MNTNIDTNEIHSEDLIDLGAATAETKGNQVSGIDNAFQKLPNASGLIAD